MSFTDRAAIKAPLLSVFLVGLVSAIISWGRLWLFDNRAPFEVLWAEDGLFPLCIHKADFFTCLVDPFAGYFLFVPRVLAWPISMLPWEMWATATNIVAAVFVGVVSALSLLILRRAGMSWFVSVAAALLPSLAPMVGLEAINALGSSYMPLLFLATIFLALPPVDAKRESSTIRLIAGAVLLLITALTIPSAVVLLGVVLLMAIPGRQALPSTIVWSLSLILGLIAQFWVAINADAPRAISLSAETLQSWADSVPVSVLTYWPGISIGEYSFFTNFTLTPLAITGWAFVVGFLLLGSYLAMRDQVRLRATGVLILAGLGFGLIPSAIGYANNRYFVVPLLLFGTALLIWLDPRIRKTKWWILVLVSALVLAIWWPALPASAFRATPAPLWSEEVARVEARCATEPDFVDRPLFTPFWPPNWGDGLIEPTHPNLPCPIVWRWFD